MKSAEDAAALMYRLALWLLEKMSPLKGLSLKGKYEKEPQPK